MAAVGAACEAMGSGEGACWMGVDRWLCFCPSCWEGACWFCVGVDLFQATMFWKLLVGSDVTKRSSDYSRQVTREQVSSVMGGGQ